MTIEKMPTTQYKSRLLEVTARSTREAIVALKKALRRARIRRAAVVRLTARVWY